MDALGFTYTTAQSPKDGYFQMITVKTVSQARNIEIYLTQLQSFITGPLTAPLDAAFEQQRGVRILPIIHCLYEKPIEEKKSIVPILPMALRTLGINSKDEIPQQLQQLASNIKDGLQFFSNFIGIAHLELHLAQHKPRVRGGPYVELPEFLAHK